MSCLVAGKERLEKGLSPVHRRVQGEMGSNPRSVSSLRFLEQGGVKGAYQQARVRAIFYALQSLQDVVLGKTVAGFLDNTTTLSYIRSQREQGHGTVPFGGRPVSLDGREECYSAAVICAGQKQHCSGHLEQEGTSDLNRVDLKSSSMQDVVETMGSSSSGRLCYFSDHEAGSLLCSSSGSQCSGSGCVPTTLGQPGPVCFSSFCPHSKSDKQVQTGKELSIDSCSSVVASEGVVPGSSRSSSGLPKGPSSEARSVASTSKQNSASRSPHSSSDRLETILRLGRAKGFSETISKRLFNARSVSTNALYQLRWKQYVSWCRSNKLSAIRPSVNSLCKFFIHLWEDKKLSVGTIKGFQSVVQSVLRHVYLDISHIQIFQMLLDLLLLRSLQSGRRQWPGMLMWC